MDPLTAGLISGGIAAGGSLLSNIWGAGEASKNRDFQEQMSSTAHQRQVADLRAAGLNPILSALGSGASSPGGSQANINDMGPGLSKGFETGMGMRMLNQQIENMRQQEVATHATGIATSKQGNLAAEQATYQRELTKNKELENKLLRETLPDLIKQARAKGDWSQVNQLMGVIKAGTSSASDIRDMVSPRSYFFPSQEKNK